MGDQKIRLGLSMRGLGYHPSAWLDPAVPPGGALTFAHYLDMAQTAERGMFDLVFLADMAGMTVADTPKGAFGRTASGAEFEPLTLLAALSQLTKHVGLVATASTTLHQPYQLARQFASIDHLSGGRAGWNVVTSSRDTEARNFNEEKILAKDLRYERAREALDICLGLWDSWEPDAFPHDRAKGVFFEPSKMHPINHKGKFFRVDGPLTLPPTPQGRPLIIQAGASEGGRNFAASVADLVYALQNKFDEARDFYRDIKRRAGGFGRAPDDIKIMPGLLAVVGDSKRDAEARFKRMQEEVDPLVGLERLVRFFGDLSGHDLDKPPPDLRIEKPSISRGDVWLEMARRNNYTIRQLYQETSVGHSHHVVMGSPSEIVDVMEKWFTEGAADGFNVLPAKSPGDVHRFVELVVPELQKRGLFRTAYEGRTLRENLGLGPVAGRHAEAAAD